MALPEAVEVSKKERVMPNIETDANALTGYFSETETGRK
jgi:hypothetical protein